MVAGRLQEPARISPALVERLAEPLFGLYRDLADRLTATGEVDLGLVTRRALVELLRGLAGRLGDPARVAAGVDAGRSRRDLLAADRVEEAEAAATEAAAIVLDGSTPARPGCWSLRSGGDGDQAGARGGGGGDACAGSWLSGG